MSDTNGNGRQKLFQPTITIGNLLSVFGILISATVVYSDIRVLIARQEERLDYIEQRISDFNNLPDLISKMQIDIATIRAIYQAQLQPPVDKPQ